MNFRDRPSPNHGPRECAVDMLVLHYTGMKTAADALERLTSPAAQVSAHYLIDEDGTAWRLVPEERRAWHAGLSFWRGRSDINSASVGIELVNPGHEFGYREFPEPQIASLVALCREILARHAVPARHVLGHSDVAPARKQDPGELFPWARLAAAGIGLFPAPPSPAAKGDLAALLAAIGYAPGAASVTAFQRHFRPSRCDGFGDDETLSLAAAVAKLCGEI